MHEEEELTVQAQFHQRPKKRGKRSAETARVLIRRAKQATRRRFPAEEKIRIVMEGIRAEVSWRICAVAREFIPRSITSG